MPLHSIIAGSLYIPRRTADAYHRAGSRRLRGLAQQWLESRGFRTGDSGIRLVPYWNNLKLNCSILEQFGPRSPLTIMINYIRDIYTARCAPTAIERLGRKPQAGLFHPGLHQRCSCLAPLDNACPSGIIAPVNRRCQMQPSHESRPDPTHPAEPTLDIHAAVQRAARGIGKLTRMIPVRTELTRLPSVLMEGEIPRRRGVRNPGPRLGTPGRHQQAADVGR